ncbi:MAG: hypothetical protein IJI14_12060 [Anaerolineaceae bacterium]|nr:hypothetical protein [Anaerolineaceae bacterium]
MATVNGMTTIPQAVLDEKNRIIRQLSEENLTLHRQINAMRYSADLMRHKDLLPPTLNTKQVGEFLGISTARARQLIVERRIAGAFQLEETGLWFVLTDKFIDYIEEHITQVQEELPV